VRAVLSRGWPAVVLLAAAGVFALALRGAIAEHFAFPAFPPLVLAALLALVLGAIVLAARAVLPGPRTLGAAAAACLTASAALLAAAPVELAYDDGCNDHGTVAPVLLVPALALTRPDRAVGAYEDSSTLMACFDGGPALRH
jgi:hypothetical protein